MDKYVLQIQNCYRLYKSRKLLKNIIHIYHIGEISTFSEFQKLLTNKQIILNTQLFIHYIEKFKKTSIIKPKIFLSSFLIKFFSNELLGNTQDRHPIDDYILYLANKISYSFINLNINLLCSELSHFQLYFTQWTTFDKNRMIERMIISFYYRNQHINKIKNLENTPQNIDLINELQNQSNEILTSIKLIDKNFDINYLKANYVTIFNSIYNAWNDININLSITMKKVFYDMLCNDILSGNMLSIFKLIKDIEKRLTILMPKNISIKNKFNDDYIIQLLDNNNNFTPELTQFIIFIIDTIILLDAPINDPNNKIWKNNIIHIINNNQQYHLYLPLIFLQIHEHIDLIYSYISNL